MTGGEYRESRAGHEAGRRMLSVNIVASTQAFRENPAVVNIGGGPYQNRVGKQLGWMPFGASKTDSDELIMHWILFFFFSGPPKKAVRLWLVIPRHVVVFSSTGRICRASREGARTICSTIQI